MKVELCFVHCCILSSQKCTRWTEVCNKCQSAQTVKCWFLVFTLSEMEIHGGTLSRIHDGVRKAHSRSSVENNSGAARSEAESQSGEPSNHPEQRSRRAVQWSYQKRSSSGYVLETNLGGLSLRNRKERVAIS